MTKKIANVEIDLTFPIGYLRPSPRGILLGNDYTSLDQLIEDACNATGRYSVAGGSKLKDIHILIEIGEVKQG